MKYLLKKEEIVNEIPATRKEGTFFYVRKSVENDLRSDISKIAHIQATLEKFRISSLLNHN